MRTSFAHYERCRNAFEKAWMKVCDAAFYGGKQGSIKREAACDAMWNWPDGWWEFDKPYTKVTYKGSEIR